MSDFNFFLYNSAINVPSFEEFKQGMSELVAIPQQHNDYILKHDSLWEISHIENLYSNFGQDEQVISNFVSKSRSISNYINDEASFDNMFPDSENAFLGINFSEIEIQRDRQIINQLTYEAFKKVRLWSFDFRSLWDKRQELFPNLVLCGDVQSQILSIGNSKYFNQIVEKLIEFNEAVSEWKDGAFNYQLLNRNYALRISPESVSTMNIHGSSRRFSLPKGGTEIFELHIKTGDLRFHFYPDNSTKTVYIGYIGHHLETVSG